METTAAAAANPEARKPFNKKDLVAALAEQHHLSKRASQEMLDASKKVAFRATKELKMAI
jgi:nucleoid DNA-binding protein